MYVSLFRNCRINKQVAISVTRLSPYAYRIYSVNFHGGTFAHLEKGAVSCTIHLRLLLIHVGDMIHNIVTDEYSSLSK